MTAEVGNALISFRSIPDEPGVRVRDELEGRDLLLGTDGDASIQRISTDRFIFPVDVAVSATTGELHIPIDTTVYLRDEAGEHLGEFTETPRDVPRGTYFLELSGATKTYIRLPDVTFTGRADVERGVFIFDFETVTAFDVGARSLHRRPQATVTVPDDPRALLDAVSVLGSSIKEFSCERSWPTLRGHPPALEPGDELSIPAELSTPETGVTITVPPTYADAFRVAPLAFYLGATVEPGSERALHLDVGYTEPLGETGRELEAAVDELLARCFFLDTITRVGGYYSMPRAEYDGIAAHLPFYPPNLYDQSIGAQLLEYLEVPASALEPFLPRWSASATLRPELDDVALLPSLLDLLARVHVADGGDPPAPVSTPAVRGYTGPTPPDGGTRLVESAFTRGLRSGPAAPENATFRFVDASEDAVDGLREVAGVYADAVAEGSGEIARTAKPTRKRLRRALESETDYLAFGGEVTERGFACRDGVLAFEDVERVQATTVVFGGHAALEGATRLVEAGAVSGLVAAPDALTDRVVGRLAGYLLVAFPLTESARLAELDYPIRFVGDPTHLLVRRSGGQPATLVDVESMSEDQHRFSNRAVLSRSDRLGSVAWMRDDYAQDAYQLFGASVEHPHTLTSAEVVDLVRDDDVAVRLNGSVYHASEADERTIRRAARRALERRPD